MYTPSLMRMRVTGGVCVIIADSAEVEKWACLK